MHEHRLNISDFLYDISIQNLSYWYRIYLNTFFSLDNLGIVNTEDSKVNFVIPFIRLPISLIGLTMRVFFLIVLLNKLVDRLKWHKLNYNFNSRTF